MYDWILDTSGFITRNRCGVGWTVNLILVNRLANFIIFLSYVSIPFSLLYLWVRLRTVFPYWTGLSILNRIILLNFVCFIVLCGITHLCDVLVFEYAPYRLYTLIDILTALASVPTAIVLPEVVRTIALGETDER